MTIQKLIEDVAELNKAIDAWGSRGAKWVAEGQHLALSALSRLAAHGDIGPINRLYKAMPKGTKTAAMGEWILAFGSVIANTDTVTRKDKPFVFDKSKKTDMEAAAAKHWSLFAPEPEPIALFDVQAQAIKVLERLLVQAGKAAKVEHRNAFDTIRATIETLKALPADVIEE